MTGPLLDVGAGVALLLWGLAVLRGSVPGAASAGLAAWLGGTRHRLAALALGLVAGAAMSADSVLTRVLGAPLAKGALAPATALAALLGAEAGAALTALLLATPLPGALELLTLAGVVLALGWRHAAAARVGEGLLGLALVLMALRLLGPVAGALAQDPVPSALVAALAGDTLLALTLGAGAAIVLRSGTAAVLLLALLCSAGVLALPVALLVMLGANLGGGILALAATAGGPAQPREVAAGLLVFKSAAVACCVAALHGYGAATLALDLDAALVLAGAHLLFNAASALAFTGLTATMATVVGRWMAGDPAGAQADIARLDPRALPVPSVALTCAARELVRMADLVELMLGGMLQVFLRDDLALARSVRGMDDAVDTCYREVKHYLAAIERPGLSADEERRWSELMTFAIALEQVADTVERVLHDLEDSAPANPGTFPGPAIAEVCGLHAVLMHNLRLAVNLLLERNDELAQALVAADGSFLELERSYEASHLRRLAAGEPGSSAISAVYIDLLSDFERMNTLACSLGSCFLRLRRPAGDAPAPPREPPHHGAAPITVSAIGLEGD